MEISLREWLIIGGIVVIALILFDGWRRISASRNRLKIDIDKSLSELGETTHHNPELPNGGARVRKYDQEPEFTPHTQVTSELEPDVEPVELQSPEPNQLHESDEAKHDDTDYQTAMDQEALHHETHKALDEEPLYEEPLDQAALDQEIINRESSLQDSIPQTSEPQVLEWDPELEKQFDNVDFRDDEPTIDVQQPTSDAKNVTPNFADLDPLFDDIPTDPLPPLKSPNTADKPVSELPKESTKDAFKEEPNLFLDLDLDQPIHQLMANKAAETKAANREASRRAKDKPTAREDHKSLSLPLEPDLERKLEPNLDDLFADFDGINPLEEVSVEPIKKSSVKAETNIPSVEQSNVNFQAITQSEKQADNKASSNAQDLEKSRSAATAARKALSDLPDPEEVLVITVVGKNRQHLDGVRLQRVVEACGMEHGDMSIYHRFDGTGAAASLQFSMANAVNPGTFDPNAMDALETPAVSFFMSMREPRDAMTAYECMLATAETLAKNMDGDLLDEDRSVMREQTKEHYRQRIRDFEMQTRRRNLTR